MVFYTPEDLVNGTFKQKSKPVISKQQQQQQQQHGGTLQETFADLSITPAITKRKQIKKLNEIEEPSSVKDKLKVFIDFNFK
jgi:hypothetical protein